MGHSALEKCLRCTLLPHWVGQHIKGDLGGLDRQSQHFPGSARVVRFPCAESQTRSSIPS